MEAAIEWLRIRGRVTLAYGKTWALIPAADAASEGVLEFLEPNIAFRVEERAADRVQVRVCFSLEALPPQLRGTGKEPDLFEYVVRLGVSAGGLTRAAESWMPELAEFPERCT